jgi:type I restriction enzyme S subunit
MDWGEQKLSLLCDMFTDGDWVESKDQSAEGIRLIQTGNVGEGVFKNRRDKSRFISEDTFNRLKCTEIIEGDCLVSRLPDPVGRSCLIPNTGDRMITAVDCTIIRLNKSRLLPEFFTYFTQSYSYLNTVESLTSGATRTRISRKNLGEVPIPLPPIPEQQRIVAILDQAFADIEKARANAEKNLKNARELFDSYLNQVFSQRGEGWVEDSVGNMAEHNLGKMLDKQKNKGDLSPYLRNLSVRWFDFNLDDILKMRFEDREVDRYSVRKGDLMICEGGYPGRAAIWDNSETMFYQKAIHRVRFKNTVYNKWLLYYLYLSDSNETLRTHFTGAGIQHFTGKALGALRLAFPPERDAYVILADIEKLHDLVRELEQPYERKLASLDELKKSLLQKAFSGELTKTEDMVA